MHYIVALPPRAYRGRRAHRSGPCSRRSAKLAACRTNGTRSRARRRRRGPPGSVKSTTCGPWLPTWGRRPGWGPVRV